MGRLSARSNPTGLKELDRKRACISVSEGFGRRSFTLDRLDVSGTGLSDSLRVVVIAKAGNTNSRHVLGSISAPLADPVPIDDLDRSQPLRFRVLLHEDDSPRLAASIENLRPRDDSQSESLLPMEPADLGERLWKLVINDEGPVLQFNASVFPSAPGAENYLPFGTLVLPEALRQVMAHIAGDPECLEDPDDPWSAWGRWLKEIGAEAPPGEAEADDELKDDWCNRVVDRFCSRFRFASRLQEELLKGDGSV